MAEVIQLAKAGSAGPATGGFVMTESAEDIIRSLCMVGGHDGGAITLISAAPGTGKTHSLMHFKMTQRPDAVFHTAVADEDDTPWGAACQLMETLGIGSPNNRNLRESRQKIAAAIGVDGLLIVDEAQNLVRRNTRGKDDWSTMEWFRAMSEEGCFSLVFSGDLALLETSQRLPQLWRRMRRRVIVNAVSQADVQALAEKRGIDDQKVTEALYQMARRGGGLGDADNVIDHARLLAGGQVPRAAHILAAMKDLKLVQTGGK